MPATPPSSTHRATLPPYLTSGASSRAHHALLVRLNEAGSSQEEDEIISEEISRAKGVLSVKGQSMGKIADTLLVLLHCSMLRHRTDDDLEFALVYALQLAEGGRTIGERRIGYLYLVERLPHEHELTLLLVNTIRKDLSSASPSYILLALHTIVKLPSTDLAPAVTPLLTSKGLLKHKVPAVRQRTLEALLALHRPYSGNETLPFPLSMGKLLRLVEKENETPVVALLYRTIRVLLAYGLHRAESEGEADYIAETIVRSIQQLREISSDFGQVDLEALRALEAAARCQVAPSASVLDGVSRWLADRLRSANHQQTLGEAFLLESCRIVSVLPDATNDCLRHISRLLLHDSDSSSSTGPPPLPKPNDHILALRCMMSLPREAWDGKLGQAEMGVIMEGVNSADNAIRRRTIRLLDKLSPELPDMVFKGYLDSLRASSSLSLPASLASNLTIEEKTAIGRNETASRALEVLDVQSRDDGERYAKGVTRLLEVFDKRERTVWEEGVRIIVDKVRAGTKPFSEKFASAFGRTLSAQATPSSDNTAIAILCTVMCEYPPSSAADSQDILTLLCAKLPIVNASVQELVLIGLLSILMGKGDSTQAAHRQQALDAVKALASKLDISRYLQKRCAEIITAIEQGLLEHVESRPDTRNLSGLASAMSSVVVEYERGEQKKKQAKGCDAHSRSLSHSSSQSHGSPSPRLGASRSLMTASLLRYDAYDPPATRTKVAKKSRHDRGAYRDRGDDESDSERSG
ncbi:hypothetical protein IAU59_004658 [Kwoniella sp. CBS 9459]